MASAARTLTATATDALSTVAAAEWYADTEPGVGKGTSMTVSGSALSASIAPGTLTAGTHTLWVRAKDALGNWGAPVSVTVTVQVDVPFTALWGQQHLPISRPFDTFLADCASGQLPAVSFIKSLGPDNEHPGYSSLTQGQQHVATLVQANAGMADTMTAWAAATTPAEDQNLVQTVNLQSTRRRDADAALSRDLGVPAATPTAS